MRGPFDAQTPPELRTFREVDLRMRWHLFAIALALSVLGAGSAVAQTGLTFPLEILETWSMTYNEGPMGGRPARVTEFVPQGQTVESWTEMITIIVIDTRRGRPKPTGPSIYDELTAGYRAACGQTSFSEPVSTVENGLATTTFSMACDVARDGPTVGSGDYTYVKIIEAPPDNLYMAQRAWRGALPDPSVRPITDEQFREWMTFFDGVRVLSLGP